VTLLRTLAVPFLVLGLAVSCGKKTPEGTTPPGETGSADAGASAGDGGGDAGAGGGDAGGEAGGGDAGATPPEGGADPSKVCDAEVSETPKALFGDNVLIRLPKGVELVEQNEVFARITSSTTQSTCDAIVSFAAVGYFATDTTKPVTVIRDETIKARGLNPTEAKWDEETTKNRDYSASYELPEGPKGEPPLKGWIVFKEKAGTTFWAAFETHPNAWNAVKKSFQESGKRLLITKK
jgi:hypothetical protein